MHKKWVKYSVFVSPKGPLVFVFVLFCFVFVFFGLEGATAHPQNSILAWLYGTDHINLEYGPCGVVWHTGKVLSCGAVGPRFKPRQGQGGFCRAYSVLNQDGTLLQWRGRLV